MFDPDFTLKNMFDPDFTEYRKHLACESLQAGSLSYFTPAILLLKFSKKIL
jgi:hypothetical protein